jgi:hypothetical protein
MGPPAPGQNTGRDQGGLQVNASTNGRARPAMGWRVPAMFAAVAALAACGGGGGGGDGAGTPAPAPPQTQSPPAYAGARLSLAALPSACLNTACVPYVATTVDANGEASFFWTEAVPGATPRLRAAHHAAGAAALLGSGDIASNYNTASVAPSFLVRPLARRRFVVWQADHPAPGQPSTLDTPLHARVVTFGDAGPPTVGPLTGLPNLLSSSMGESYPFPSTMQVEDGSLYAFNDMLAAGTVVPLGDGVTLTVVPRPTLPIASAAADLMVEYPQSIAPRAMWAMRAGPSFADSPEMVLADVSLPDATVLPVRTVSTAPFSVVKGSVTCQLSPPMRVRAAVTTAIYQVVAWSQVNAAVTGCELVVNGEKVSGAGHLGRYDLSVSGNEVVAVWEECNAGACKLYWSRKPPSITTNTAWTPPAAVAPAHVVATDTQQITAMTAGPNATLLVAWTNWQPTSPSTATNDGTWRVSKYANGQWSTVQIASPEDPYAMSINAAGQGAIMTLPRLCTGNDCDLAAYRF